MHSDVHRRRQHFNLPDKFNFGAADIAPAITKLRLDDNQQWRSVLERQPIVEIR
jgi:hypothetical protein